MKNIHHIAIKATSLIPCHEFYTKTLGLSEKARHHYKDGTLRSIWYDLDGVVLMLEHSEEEGPVSPNGYHVIALKIAESEKAAWIKKLKDHGVALQKQTECTLYFKDPQGNLWALSHYP